MATYTYRNGKGQRRQREYPLGEAPERFQYGGQTWVRDLVADLMTVQTTAEREPGYRHRAGIGHSWPRWHPSAPRHDEQGRPVFHNRAEWDDACSRAQDRDQTPVTYDAPKPLKGTKKL